MEQEAAALRRMLELLDQIEALMDDAAYTDAGERRIKKARKLWMDQLATVESTLAVQWKMIDMPRA